MKIEPQFIEVITLIKKARYQTFKAVNKQLINLYWEIGSFISQRTKSEGWGKSTVLQLATFILAHEPELKGFSDKNLWRMKQFYESYKDFPEVSTLLRELSWSHNLAVFSRCKTPGERAFYLSLSKKEHFTLKELERQISASVYERVVIGDVKLSTALRVLPNQPKSVFKDNYIFEFLNLTEFHNESDLQNGIIKQISKFILELGKDFLFVGQEYKVQVGNTDFFIDLLFYHRTLQCLVAFELKADKFKPEHLGQLNFYLEALDRDVKKEHENPSIGILLCKDKDNEVVEYAMSRNLSPTLISQYTIALPDKKLLQAKLHELYESFTNEEDKL